MYKKPVYLIGFLAVLGIASLACGVSIDMGDEASAPAPVVVQPTQPLPPTAPLQPSPIPPTPVPPPTTIAASPAPKVPPEYQEKVNYYYEKGYLSSTKGEYTPLEDFSKDHAKIGYDFTQDTGHRPKNFMVTAHFEWQSAIKHPDTAGCGWSFRRNGADGYYFWVDKEYVRLVSWNESAQDGVVFGTASGSPYVGMGNPADADVVLIVNELKAYVLVDNNFKGSYSLDTDFLTGKGDLAYTVVSGTNKDYGTRCRITEAVLWEIED